MPRILYFRYDERQCYRIAESGFEMVNWLNGYPLIIRHDDQPGAITSSADLRELWQARPKQRMSPTEYQAELERALARPDVRIRRDSNPETTS